MSRCARLAEVNRLVDELENAELISDGQFNALAMLVVDATLSGDEPSLAAAHSGLQWLYGRHAEEPAEEHLERRGRLLGLIDVLHWALRRAGAS